MKWNPFNRSDDDDGESLEEKLAAIPGAPRIEDMKWHERLAMKRFLKMSPEEQKKVVAKAMTPKNIEKNKDSILASLEEAKKAGMMSDDQYRLAKRKLGIK